MDKGIVSTLYLYRHIYLIPRFRGSHRTEYHIVLFVDLTLMYISTISDDNY